MRSAIYANEIVANRNRKFGAAGTYYPARLIRSDGSAASMLFTEAELSNAVNRARANAEDVNAAVVARAVEQKWARRAALFLCGLVVAFTVVAGTAVLL